MENVTITSSDFFPTSTPAMAEETKQEIIDRQTAEITNLKQTLATSQNMREHWERRHNELQQKIANVKGYLFDVYSETGNIEEELKEIADLLSITLMKQIAGTATFEISWTAQVPLEFDADDFEISFDVNCESYEADDFEWDEDNCHVQVEEA